MMDAVNRFYSSIERASEQSQSSLIELFMYFLTVECAKESVSAKDIDQCFVFCHQTPPKATATRLSEGFRAKPQKFIRAGTGYKLQRHMREVLSRKLGEKLDATRTSTTLRSLEQKIPAGSSRDFLIETIDCFEVGANRATIVMAWTLAVNQLFDYILKHKIAEFNASLAQNSDRRVKVSTINQRDDFCDIPEKKFIEFCRVAKIISNDVRKILDQKLEIRNSCAHPSGVKIKQSKVIEFVEDIVENVIIKFEL